MNLGKQILLWFYEPPRIWNCSNKYRHECSNFQKLDTGQTISAMNIKISSRLKLIIQIISCFFNSWSLKRSHQILSWISKLPEARNKLDEFCHGNDHLIYFQARVKVSASKVREFVTNKFQFTGQFLIQLESHSKRTKFHSTLSTCLHVISITKHVLRILTIVQCYKFDWKYAKKKSKKSHNFMKKNNA